jgi:hypothetical protein
MPLACRENRIVPGPLLSSATFLTGVDEVPKWFETHFSKSRLAA